MYYKSLFSLLLITTASCLLAQSKQDYYWPLAFSLDHTSTLPGIEFDFNTKPFNPKLRNEGLVLDQMNASICDQDGQLLFYTNGCAVANRNHEIMPNGEGINDGSFFNDFWGGDCKRGYTGTQDICILSDPSNEEGFYIIHKPITYDSTSFDFPFQRDSFLYTYVDMTLDEGNGNVVIKNEIFHKASLLFSYLTPISKPNSLDWWIMNPVFPSGYVVFSLTESGIELHDHLDGPTWDVRKSSASGHARFSPDGTKYAYFNQFDGLYLYDFDRSDATLSNEQHIPWRRPEEGIFSSCEWSPNSRFLYMCRPDTLWQLDTQTLPLEDGLEFIAKYLGGDDYLQPSFGIAALGPDCRIYIRGKSSANSMHIIHKPDEKGMACDFVEQGLQLPATTNVGSFPNFPRFRVDEEDKCDPNIVSAFGEVVYYRRDLITYPNPVRDNLTIELPEGVGDGMLYVLDMQGQMLHSQEVSVLTGSMQLSMSHMTVGMYAVEYVPRDNKDRVVYTSRVTRVE